MGFFIAGVVLLALAVILLAFFFHYRRRDLAIRRTDTYTAAEIEDLRRTGAAAVGGGGFFARMVEVKGIGECPQPLAAPLTQTPCAAYRTRVEREYEYERLDQDAQGRAQRRREHRSETVSHDEQQTEFLVRDATGATTVDPRGARVDYLRVAQRYEPAHTGMGSVSFGGIRVSVPGGFGTGSRTLGYRYTEEVLPLGQQLYVLGEASDRDGRLAVRKPQESGMPYLITTRSEEELRARARRYMLWLRIGAAAAAGVGLALVIVGLVAL